jgi:hypothetical protein
VDSKNIKNVTCNTILVCIVIVHSPSKIWPRFFLDQAESRRVAAIQWRRIPIFCAFWGSHNNIRSLPVARRVGLRRVS